MNIQFQLAATPLFKNVDLQPFSSQLNDWCHVYRDKQVLFRQGEAANCLVILLSGTVSVRTDETHIVMRQAPEVIGELALAGGPSTRTATVIASGIVQTIEMPFEIASTLLSNLVFMRNLLQVLSEKLAQATGERATHYNNENDLIAAFDSHMSPALTAQVLVVGQNYGAPRQISGTILFADIRGFTDKSQTLEPAVLAEQLGSYFEVMVSILHSHGAFVDKFIGDAVMAFWGLPSHSPLDPSSAFSCAEEMISKASLKNLAGQPVEIGVGLAKGDIFCGNVGSEQKRQFTVLGSAVNLAARCESLCKDLNAQIVMSKDVYESLDGDQQSRCSVRENTPVKGVGSVDLFVSQRDNI